MSAALRLSQLQKEKGGEPLSVALLEKARESGAHMLSGAVLDPSTLAQLIPDFKAKGAPLAAEVTRDDVYVLTQKGQWRFPMTPPPLTNHGHYIISLNQLVKWLGKEVEAAGVDLFSGFAAQDVLFDGARVIGVRTGDRGLDKQGGRKSTFEPGVDVHAKVTILLRRRSRQPDEDAHAGAEAQRGPAAAALRARHQGTLGGSEGPRGRRLGHAHDGLSAAPGRIRRRVHLRAA